MSNQVFSNETWQYNSKSWSYVKMLTNLNYNASEYLASTNYNNQYVWCQLGSEVTKNGVRIHSLGNVIFDFDKSYYYGPTLDLPNGSLKIHRSGAYNIVASIGVVRNPLSASGNKTHYIGISINGNDPMSPCATTETDANTFVSVSCSEIMVLEVNDIVSVCYAQATNPVNEVRIKFSLYVKEV